MSQEHYVVLEHLPFFVPSLLLYALHRNDFILRFCSFFFLAGLVVPPKNILLPFTTDLLYFISLHPPSKHSSTTRGKRSHDVSGGGSGSYILWGPTKKNAFAAFITL